eukprot:scaffold583214_cov21-Prasinocladus_malaysianus.AAC.1
MAVHDIMVEMLRYIDAIEKFTRYLSASNCRDVRTPLYVWCLLVSGAAFQIRFCRQFSCTEYCWRGRLWYMLDSASLIIPSKIAIETLVRISQLFAASIVVMCAQCCERGTQS